MQKGAAISVHGTSKCSIPMCQREKGVFQQIFKQSCPGDLTRVDQIPARVPQTSSSKHSYLRHFLSFLPMFSCQGTVSSRMINCLVDSNTMIMSGHVSWDYVILATQDKQVFANINFKFSVCCGGEEARPWIVCGASPQV